MRPGFFVRESLRSMRRNAVPSFAALATVLVTTLVIGVFIPVVQATNGAANAVRNRVQVDVFLNTTATAADDARVLGELRHAPHVKSIQFVSKDRRRSPSRASSTRRPTRRSATTRCPTRSA